MKVIGLISGTSVDGIDAALVDIRGEGFEITATLLASETYPYEPALRQQILAAGAGQPLSVADLASLDDAIAFAFASAAQDLQSKNALAELVASHGQTVFHRPVPSDQTETPVTLSLGYSLQLGRGDAIAAVTQLPTVSNFRAADIAVGGQGAPLVSPVDACLLSHPQQPRCVQNLGGIGNVTYLPSQQNQGAAGEMRGVFGWDTGPANSLLDLAVSHFSQGQQTYDSGGRWAAQGTPCQLLVDQWLQQPYFHQPPPKSTGRELFGWAYWQQCLAEAEAHDLSPADILSTLTQLTVASIVQSYADFLPAPPAEVLLCGGGSRNGHLLQQLQQHLQPIPVLTTDEAGLSADAKEAIAFAVLGFWRYHGISGNLPSVTGARQRTLLGNLCWPLRSR
ncbi:MAG: anhydro-N-acetylmuramic acid kinase [Leptolyngbyaceae cyanobacterium RM1_1_2]|nr:anhydro-N-acetylmuramic acid kinase [Leptolyngbyaceae cyanobacterium RM1_1_2]